MAAVSYTGCLICDYTAPENVTAVMLHVRFAYRQAVSASRHNQPHTATGGYVHPNHYFTRRYLQIVVIQALLLLQVPSWLYLSLSKCRFQARRSSPNACTSVSVEHPPDSFDSVCS
jgi:hypothetical protein